VTENKLHKLHEFLSYIPNSRKMTLATGDRLNASHVRCKQERCMWGRRMLYCCSDG